MSWEKYSEIAKSLFSPSNITKTADCAPHMEGSLFKTFNTMAANLIVDYVIALLAKLYQFVCGEPQAMSWAVSVILITLQCNFIVFFSFLKQAPLFWDARIVCKCVIRDLCTIRAPVFDRHQFFRTSEHYGKSMEVYYLDEWIIIRC